MTHITIMTIGTRGDVQPCVALGIGFKRKGYDVRIAAPPDFEAMIADHGLEFAPHGPEIKPIIDTLLGVQMMHSGNDSITFLRSMRSIMGEIIGLTFEQSLEASQGTDAILFNTIAHNGYQIAEALNIPVAGAWVYPLNRTRFYPPIAGPQNINLGPLNKCTYRFYEAFIQMLFGRALNDWRKTLGLKPMHWQGIFEHMERRQTPMLYGYSPHVRSRPEDWPDFYTVTGFWFLDAPADWQLPQAFTEFLDSGEPPVFIGFGSTPGTRALLTVDFVKEVARLTGRRIVFTPGWGGTDTDVVNQPVDEGIFVLYNAPFNLIFPRMAAVVHHAGGGTTAIGLRAGIPTVTVPFGIDQPFWANRVYQLGVGPHPIPYRKLTPERLADTINEVLADKQIATRTAALGKKIREEDGITAAVEFFEKVM